MCVVGGERGSVVTVVTSVSVHCEGVERGSVVTSVRVWKGGVL